MGVVFPGTLRTNMPLSKTIHHVFEHNWEDVSLASWHKYPSEDRPDVLSVDLVDRKFDPETGVLTATRLVIMQDGVPKILKPILGSGTCICLEHSVVDPKQKTMILKARNITFESVATIEETFTYTENPENKFTNFLQQAEVRAYPFGVKGQIEQFLTNKFVNNAPLGQVIMENTVERVKSKSFLDSLGDAWTACGKRLDSLKVEWDEKLTDMEGTWDHYADIVKSEWDEKVNEVESYLHQVLEVPSTVLEKYYFLAPKKKKKKKKK